MDAAAMTLRQPSRSWEPLIALIPLRPVQIAMSSPQLRRGLPRPLPPVLSHRRCCRLGGIGRVEVAGDVAIPYQFSSFGNIDEGN